jgi:hypothetical protein
LTPPENWRPHVRSIRRRSCDASTGSSIRCSVRRCPPQAPRPTRCS